MPTAPPLPGKKAGSFYRAESYGFSREFMDYVRRYADQVERGSAAGRALFEGQAVHIPDVLLDPEYAFPEGQRLGGFRTLLGIPMLREGDSNRRPDLVALGSHVPLPTNRLNWSRPSLTRRRSRLRMFACLKASRPARANLPHRWRIYAPRKTASSRRRSSLRLVSSPLASRTRSKTRSILSTISRVSPSN